MHFELKWHRMASFERYRNAKLSTREELRRDIWAWLLTSLVASIAPFAIVALAYRIEYETTHHAHRFPSFTMLFGGGELLLVILSVTGATLAEFWTNPGHFKSLGKSAAFAASLLIALAAGALFTVITYGDLTGHQSSADHAFVAQLSVALLSMVVIIQSVTLLTRDTDLKARSA